MPPRWNGCHTRILLQAGVLSDWCDTHYLLHCASQALTASFTVKFKAESAHAHSRGGFEYAQGKLHSQYPSRKHKFLYGFPQMLKGWWPQATLKINLKPHEGAGVRGTPEAMHSSVHRASILGCKHGPLRLRDQDHQSVLNVLSLDTCNHNSILRSLFGNKKQQACG